MVVKQSGVKPSSTQWDKQGSVQTYFQTIFQSKDYMLYIEQSSGKETCSQYSQILKYWPFFFTITLLQLRKIKSTVINTF